MKKFLVVGLGGSGGATLRYLMDQLRADLRAHGMHSLPAAWQFVHVDVNPQPETTPGLGSVIDLGGRYVSVSSAGNTFSEVRRQVESKLLTQGRLDALRGWAPRPRAQADNVPVSTGAGQHRAIGRMLTLTRLQVIHGALAGAWEDLQGAAAWGDLAMHIPDEGPYDSAGDVVPIVVGSLAGGAGASMVLDVCRVMGQITGLRRTLLGAFLYTPDVFSSLDPSKRGGIDGNAMAALGELLAAQMRTSNDADNELLTALGLTPEATNERIFGRVFPIGASIGGDGAKFGETFEDVYRGLGRALAATISSESASAQYIQTRFENPQALSGGQDVVGWGAHAPEIAWGSFGYASLSLGRDRYAEYAAQRLARAAVDRLVGGYRRNLGEDLPEDYLDSAVEHQWGRLLQSLQLPLDVTKLRPWVKDVMPENVRRRIRTKVLDEARIGEGIIVTRMDEYDREVDRSLPPLQPQAHSTLSAEVYAWSEQWAGAFEEGVLEAALQASANPLQGIPYARKMLERLKASLLDTADRLERADPESRQPLRRSPNQAVSSKGIEVSDAALQTTLDGIDRELDKELVRRAGHALKNLLRGVAHDVIGALVVALTRAHVDLEAAMETEERHAGLAQLHTEVYTEWPAGEVVPPRFDHAHNEVLLTTSEAFPATFRAHVETEGRDEGFEAALDRMVGEILIGRWEESGSSQPDYTVLERTVQWRSAHLPQDSVSGASTPEAKPTYRLAVTSREILERATAYQARTDHPFARYSQTSFEQFLNEAGVSDADRTKRREDLVSRFRETMLQARPLVGVSRPMVEAIHGQHVELELTFGTIPLAPGSVAADKVERLLEASSDLERQSTQRFRESLSDRSHESRIAVYGSYPPYSPLAFNSFTGPLQANWSQASEPTKRKLTEWKRTRPIPAAVAMSAHEMRAMIQGWYLGRALGLVHHPAERTSNDPVQVFDVQDRRWHSFPTRLVTPREQYGDQLGFEWLPGVLEGHVVALIGTVNDTSFESLKAYRALRRIHDRGAQPAATPSVSADALLADWLRTGSSMSGEPSPITVLETADPNPDARAETLHTWVDSVRTWVSEKYLTTPTGPGVLSRATNRMERPEDLEEANLFREIALEVHDALESMNATIDRALRLAKGNTDHAAPQV